MPFPLTYRGKIEFPLHGDPDITAERYYEDASYKISRSFVFDADVTVSATDNRLVVAYTVKFKKLLIISAALVLVAFGVYFPLWDLFNPPGLPQTRNPSGVRTPLTFTHIVSVMGLFWLWFFGATYVSVVIQFRSLLKNTWRRMVLPPAAKNGRSVDR
jgi:hypothetical protein